MSYLGIFGWNLKTIFSYLKGTPRICLIARFREEKKQKCLNFHPKLSADLRIFVLEFENAVVIFEICVLEFVLLQSLVKK